jgi:hypothetical protein
MNTAAPAVSVLMTVHDAGRFLAPAVRSVLAQDWRDLELVLFDNASTDGALDALLATERDPRLRVIREGKNLGIAAGTNRALTHAHGRWIAIMDHDDIALPAKLTRQIAWLEAHPEAGGVASRTALIDADGVETGGDFTLHEPAEHRAFTAFSQAANFGSHLFRRELFETFPRREIFSFSSDFDFIARAIERWPVAALPEVLFHYRVHPGQTTQVRRCEQLGAEGVIRILTALRRSGRAEPFADAPAWQSEFLAAGDPAAIHQACARRCLDLGLAVTAAYHARRSVGAAPGAPGLARGLMLCARAMRIDIRNAAHCARLFLTGPLRTYRLRPWPPR